MRISDWSSDVCSSDLLRRWLRLFGWNFRNDGRHFPRLLFRYGLSYSFGGTFLKAFRLFPAGLFTPAAAAAATASATATAAIGLLTFIDGASVYRSLAVFSMFRIFFVRLSKGFTSITRFLAN